MGHLRSRCSSPTGGAGDGKPPTFSSMTGTSDQQDTECVRRCLAGETSAFEELVVRYQRPIFKVIYQMVRNYEDAREVSQSVFLKAFSSLHGFDQEKRFFSWLYRIAMNDAINTLAARRDSVPVPADVPSEQPGPDDQFEQGEIHRLVHQALNRLKPDYRAAIVLRHFTHCSYTEAAEILEIEEKTFKSRLFTARQMLREELLSRGYGGKSRTHA